MKIETLLIDGREVEAVQFGVDHLIKGTIQDRLTIVWHTGYVGMTNRWGAEDVIADGNDELQEDYPTVIDALDHFWPGWAERAS